MNKVVCKTEQEFIDALLAHGGSTSVESDDGRFLYRGLSSAAAVVCAAVYDEAGVPVDGVREIVSPPIDLSTPERRQILELDLAHVGARFNDATEGARRTAAIVRAAFFQRRRGA